MLLSNQFPALFREELYAVNLALMDDRDLDNPFESILGTKPISGIWTMEYSVVPIGELGGRREAEPIPERNMVMGYDCYGAQSIEATGKTSLSEEMSKYSREFQTADGNVDEPRFAGHLADTIARGYELRKKQKWHRLCADIFNLGGIQAGNVFFNQFLRANGLPGILNSNLIYDGSPLFALPANAHPSYAAGALAGVDSAPVGTSVDMGGTIADTGGYFNAFLFPPSSWALERVWTHWVNNMQYDEQDEKYDSFPDTLLVSTHDQIIWDQILGSRYIEPRIAGNIQTNRENWFVLHGKNVRLVASSRLVAHTWFLGKANAGGIKRLTVEGEGDPWAYYRNEDNRTYFISYERRWGFLVRNWRNWCAGAISLDGTTPPAFNGVAKERWEIVPAGV